MRILVVGSGGREHALAWKLAQEAEVYAAPGNPGIATDVECIPVSVSDFEGLLKACRSRLIDLVVVGPEDPLVAGLADFLRSNGFSVFGPGKAGAQLEGSKAFSKECMTRAGVPTAAFATFTEPEAAKAYAAKLVDEGRLPVVKASGNAVGKGVFVCNSTHEASDSIDALMTDRQFGEAGATVVVEERLMGFEFSLLTICSGKEFWSLPVAQDYKRALDGDRGPNTGGMGSVSPVEAVSADLVAEAERSAVEPILELLATDGVPYRGTLFTGFMVQNGTPYCLEYNVRFGDPETQTIMRRLGKGLAECLRSAATGHTPIPVPILEMAAVTIVLASGGYPGTFEKGYPIEIPRSLPAEVKLFHAGTSMKDGQLVTSGGRVLGVSATGDSLSDAAAMAYSACEAIGFQGKFFRKDIAACPV
jgi:phosphoribosylamine--glycine ligase